MRVIYKYHLPIQDENIIITLPRFGDILHVGQQDEKVWVWISVNTSNAKESRSFRIVGTGHDISDIFGRGKYLGTVHTYNDRLIWHVFEV